MFRVASLSLAVLLSIGILALDAPVSPLENASAEGHGNGNDDCKKNEFGEQPACVPYCTQRVSGMRVCWPGPAL